MKKIFFIIAACIAISMSIISCAPYDNSYSTNSPQENKEQNSTFGRRSSISSVDDMFIKVGSYESFHQMYFDVVVDRDTKVMYVVSNGHDGEGVFTVLVNPDGTPRLYDKPLN